MIAVPRGGAPAQGRTASAAGGNREVFLNHHAGCRAHHRVLEDAADELGALVLRPFRDVGAGNLDRALVDGIGARDGVHQGGFARAVAADDGDEVACVEVKAHVVQGQLLGDGAGVEGLGDVLDVEHYFFTAFRSALKRACMSGSERAMATRMAVKSLRSFGGMPICRTTAMTAR